MNPEYKILSIEDSYALVEIDFGAKLFSEKQAINKPEDPMKYRTVKTSKQVFKFDVDTRLSKEDFKREIDALVLYHFSQVVKPSVNEDLSSLVGTSLQIEAPQDIEVSAGDEEVATEVPVAEEELTEVGVLDVKNDLDVIE